ncbi:hypothetical protein V7O62_08050 [Methanolobus sp. ZRKC2]|uniref:hypothetical protein n=1 Tax=Methanolobus sp. ZRKC2 TaxID=3125783 RepID=UPI0032541F98
MENMKEDTSGQWIALSGLVISLIIISLAVLANQAVIAGYYSSDAALEFPKENIRELNLQTRENAKIAKDLSYKINGTTNESLQSIYEDIFNNCSSQMKSLYAIHGETVDVTMVGMNYSTINGTNSSEISTLKVDITYLNGKSRYVANPEIIEV